MKKLKKKVNLNKIATGLKSESAALKKEVQSKSLGYIMAGFGVVTGLAWNDAIKALIGFWFPLEDKSSLIAQFGYALILTMAVVVLGVYLNRIFSSDSESEKE